MFGWEILTGNFGLAQFPWAPLEGMPRRGLRLLFASALLAAIGSAPTLSTGLVCDMLILMGAIWGNKGLFRLSNAGANDTHVPGRGVTSSA